MATKKKKATGKSTSKTASKKAGTAVEKVPRRREIGALICLLLGLFSFLGYFNIEALFIDFFGNLTKGLLGWGFYALPPVLIMCSVILGFHRGRPVRFRVTCALLFTVVLAALLHLLVCNVEYETGWAMFGALQADGVALKNGGVIGGLISIGFKAMFSKIGSAIVFVCLLIFLALSSFNLTIPGLIDWYKNRERREYAPEPPKEKTPAAKPSRKKPVNIDIPLDGETQQPQPEPEPQIKTSFFNKKPGVKTPDQILAESGDTQIYEVVESGITAEELGFDEPSYLDKFKASATIGQSLSGGEAVPASTEAPSPDAVPPMGKKLNPKDVAAESAAISQSIEKTLAEEKKAYEFPPTELLISGGRVNMLDGREEIALNAGRLETAVASFGVNSKISNVTRGPSVTRYEMELEKGVKLNKLTNLADDIALSLGASGVRIAPIPDKISMVGIEVPNKLVSTVYLREIIESAAFKNSKSKLTFALGKDISGECVIGDIAKLPHMLIAGTTGSGKSVCMNSLILSLLYKATPDEVRFIMIDPKMIELGIYNGIPHLLIPVVTDPKKAAGALQWAVTEMMKRYKFFSEVGARDISGYNAACESDPEREKLPQVVIVIDELADLMIVAAKEVEESICRIAQMARAAGMHLVIATQRPSADVITGLMKANIPSRIAFAVASGMESRIIMDTTGAEKLVGKGDMLYLPLGAGKPTRVQGAFVSDEEREAVVNFAKASGEAQYNDDVMNQIEKNAREKRDDKSDTQTAEESAYDELLPAAVDVILETGQASVSMLQRRLKLGYSRAARLVDQMEERGIVGPFEGSKPRTLLITREQWREMQLIHGTAPLEILDEDLDEDDE